MRAMQAASPLLRLDNVLRSAASGMPTAEGRHEAELLLCHVLGRDRAWLFAHATDTLDTGQVAAFEALLVRRLAGEPVAYLTGRRGFWTLELQVNADTLIPRPETELLVELALARLPVDLPTRVADLGTGSGAIALAIASERPQARAVATDASPGALAVARANALANALTNVEFRHGDWLAPLAGEQFDVIVSNPPYIASGDPHLQQGDLRFEPATALSAGSDGLGDIRQIVAGAGHCLRAGGWLLLEHGLDQGAVVRDLFTVAGFVAVETARDLEERERVTLGRLPS